MFEPQPGLTEIRPRAVLLDSKGRLWIGMRFSGVAMSEHPEAPDPVFVSYTTQKGLSSDSVWSIAEDDFGALGDTSTLADPAVVDDLIANRQNRAAG